MTAGAGHPAVRLAIMQPYFLPYIGYFQLMAAVDEFVVYDNIKYTKKGWINRNRMLRNGEAATFSLPLRADSDALDVRERVLSKDFDRRKLIAQFHGAYRRAPEFERVFPVVEAIIGHPDDDLFGFVHHAIATLAGHFGLGTRLTVSSAVPIDHALKGEEKVLALCAAAGATQAFLASKRLVARLRDERLALWDAVATENANQAALRDTADYREGFAAFQEKRRPEFTGD